MAQIEDWKKDIADAVERKFSISTQQRRVEYMQQEIDDIKVALLVEDKKLESRDHRFDHVDERIAGLLANIFVLAEYRNINLDKELQKALKWFKNPKTKPSS